MLTVNIKDTTSLERISSPLEGLPQRMAAEGVWSVFEGVWPPVADWELHLLVVQVTGCLVPAHLKVDGRVVWQRGQAVGWRKGSGGPFRGERLSPSFVMKVHGKRPHSVWAALSSQACGPGSLQAPCTDEGEPLPSCSAVLEAQLGASQGAAACEEDRFSRGGACLACSSWLSCCGGRMRPCACWGSYACLLATASFHLQPCSWARAPSAA